MRQVSFGFKMCVTPVNGLLIGDSDSFNMVKQYLQSLDLLKKHSSKGYEPFGFDTLWPTLTKIRNDTYRISRLRCCCRPW